MHENEKGCIEYRNMNFFWPSGIATGRNGHFGLFGFGARQRASSASIAGTQKLARELSDAAEGVNR
jgi:hypothetical protein